MAYRVLCDGLPLYDLRSDELVLTAPKVKLSDNSAGSLSFVITPDHPNFNSIKKLKSIIQVFQDEDEIFCGRVTEEKKDFYNQKNVYCEGELNYLVDSIQRPAEYHDQTVRGFLQTLLNIHNAQVEESKQFTVGAVTVTDANDSLYRYTNYENTLNCISEKLVKRLGGHLRIRKVNGVRYLDYLADYPVTSDQVIEFGTNLLNYSENTDASDIATAVIPLGAKLDEEDRSIAALDERVTIKSVNGGVDYLYSQTAVNNYGWVFKTVTFDEVNVPANLKTKGQAYLNDIQFEQMTLDVTAVDLHGLDVDIDKIGMLNLVRVKSAPHGLDRFFPVTEMEISIDAPESNTLKLGKEKTASMTTKNNSSNTEIIKKIEAIPAETDILNEAKENASQLIKSATQGHVVTTAEEQLIMDTDDKATATRLWRWNLNGFGYSSTGYDGPYHPAITMDGHINGDVITAGTVKAEQLDVSYRSNVERAIELAESSANEATDNKLKSYYTATAVETRLKVTKDAVLLSASETATAYTDNKLKNYSTTAQIKVITDTISSEVSKKVSNADFGTKITQNSYNVRVAWNNNSKYIQLEYGQLAIYDGSVESSKKRAVFDEAGNHFYRDGYYVGKIGTNQLQNDAAKKGLNFDLEYQGAYMTWAVKASQNAGVYTMKWSYVQSGKGWGDYTANTLHAGCDIDMHYYTLKHVNFEGGGINGTLSFKQPLGVDSSGKLSSWANATLTFKNGILTSGSWYS